MASQLDDKLASLFSRLLAKESFHIKSLLVFEDIINGSADLVGEDAQGFALIVFPFEFSHVLFSFLGFSEHEDRRLVPCPFEMVVPDLAIGNKWDGSL